MEQTFRLPWLAREHLNQQEIPSELKLPPYGVAILTRAAEVSSAP